MEKESLSVGSSIEQMNNHSWKELQRTVRMRLCVALMGVAALGGETIASMPETTRIDAPQDAWSQQSTELKDRNRTLIARKDAVLTALEAKKMKPSADIFRHKWKEIAEEFRTHNGVAHAELDKYATLLQKLERKIGYWEKWDQVNIRNADQDPDFANRYGEIAKKKMELEKHHAKLLMTDASGRMLGLYAAEKKLNSQLTTDRYLDMLAEQLRTPEDLAFFQRYFMEYAFDSTDVTKPLSRGTAVSYGEYWQTPEETLLREENGKMIGDCEDQAFLLQAIVERWGKTVIPLNIPNHITCIWIDENADRTYTAWDMGNHGLDCNGCRFGMNNDGVRVSARYCKSPDDISGFSTPIEALRSILQKYHTHPLMASAMKGWDVNNGMLLAQLPHYEHNPSTGTLERKHHSTFIDINSLSGYVNRLPTAAPPPPSE